MTLNDLVQCGVCTFRIYLKSGSILAASVAEDQMVSDTVNTMTQNVAQKTGVGLVIMRENSVLLAERLVELGDGLFTGPGGLVEANESLTDALHRELLEECGEDIQVATPRRICEIFYPAETARGHVLFKGIGFVATYLSGEALNTEPTKMGPWQWHSLENLPRLFEPMKAYIRALRTGEEFINIPAQNGNN
ncbi:TPA: NUDIX hydrolase [Candidatus Saccharibacteria bacterium]|nr:NUDIX hydrolase [Candidatus Saccharibacteria bacterium]HIO87529.1 NUDIX hydrolase [Candidatus Saccharibacteria bacterium]